jgi:predicted Zn-dependent protease
MNECYSMPAAGQPRIDAREALSLAAACAKRGELEPAMVHLKELLQADPNHEIANGMLAGIYAQLNMTDRAVAGYRRVLAVNPQNVLARFQLGLVLLTTGHPQEAVNTLHPCLADKQDFLAHFHSALALIELKRPEDARVLLTRAAQRMPVDHALRPRLHELLEQSTTPVNS